MRSFLTPLTLAVIVAALLCAADIANAQSHTRLYCSDCRDPNVHPADFGNFAFNAMREPNNGYTFDDFAEVEVINPNGQWAWVDIDFEMLVMDFGFDVPTFLIPTGNMVTDVTDATARITRYVVDLDIPNPLAVGTGTGPGYYPDGGSDDSGSDDISSSGGSGGGDYSSYEDYGDYWDGWENGYGGQMRWECKGDYSDPNNTTIICFVP